MEQIETTFNDKKSFFLSQENYEQLILYQDDLNLIFQFGLQSYHFMQNNIENDRIHEKTIELKNIIEQKNKEIHALQEQQNHSNQELFNTILFQENKPFQLAVENKNEISQQYERQIALLKEQLAENNKNFLHRENTLRVDFEKREQTLIDCIIEKSNDLTKQFDHVTERLGISRSSKTNDLGNVGEIIVEEEFKSLFQNQGSIERHSNEANKGDLIFRYTDGVSILIEVKNCKYSSKETDLRKFDDDTLKEFNQQNIHASLYININPSDSRYLDGSTCMNNGIAYKRHKDNPNIIQCFLRGFEPVSMKKRLPEAMSSLHAMIWKQKTETNHVQEYNELPPTTCKIFETLLLQYKKQFHVLEQKKDSYRKLEMDCQKLYELLWETKVNSSPLFDNIWKDYMLANAKQTEFTVEESEFRSRISTYLHNLGIQNKKIIPKTFYSSMKVEGIKEFRLKSKFETIQHAVETHCEECTECNLIFQNNNNTKNKKIKEYFTIDT